MDLVYGDDIPVTVPPTVPPNITLTVTFSEPGPIQNLPAFPFASLNREDVSNVNQTPARTAGVLAADKTYEVWTTATSGEFSLGVNFEDLAGNEYIASANGIKSFAAPDEIQKALQDDIDFVLKEARDNNTKAKLDVRPVVLVTGMGSNDFRWWITLSQHG